MSEVIVSSQSGDILTYVRGRCRVGSNPVSAALQDTQMRQHLTDLNKQFVSITNKNSQYPPEFLRRETIFLSKDKTNLNGAISAGDDSVIVDSVSDFFDPGTTTIGGFYIKRSNASYDYASYTTYASGTNTLSGLNNIDVDHLDDEGLHKIYELPTDFGKSMAFLVDNTPYKRLPPTYSQVPWPWHFTTILMENTAATIRRTFLVLPEDIGEKDCTLYYRKQATAITADTDKVDTPDGNSRLWIINKMMAYCWRNRGETDLAIDSDNEAEAALKLYLADLAESDDEIDKGPMFDTDVFFGIS